MSPSRHFVRAATMLALVLCTGEYAFGASGATSATPGTVSLPADIPVKNEKKPADAITLPKQIPEPAVPRTTALPPVEKRIPEPPKTIPPAVVSYKANLESFRAYRGEKSPAIFTALISREISATIHQEPSVALSDGKTTIKITVHLDRGDGSSPNFALTGATLISLNKDPASSSNWIIAAQPKPDTIKAGLTILTNTGQTEYPLTLAPPATGISAVEADFITFLKDSSASSPKRDLNGDGRHDYLDDFIYTANYLARKNTGSKKTSNNATPPFTKKTAK
jgi:hypothetical protein